MAGPAASTCVTAGETNIDGILLAFLGHAQELYRDADGHPTLEPGKRKARHRLRAQRVGAMIGGTLE